MARTNVAAGRRLLMAEPSVGFVKAIPMFPRYFATNLNQTGTNKFKGRFSKLVYKIDTFHQMKYTKLAKITLKRVNKLLKSSNKVILIKQSKIKFSL